MSPLADVKILVVEDEPLLCEAICEIFANEGAIVEHAENGIVAFEKVFKNEFDVVVSDIKMPKGSGIELMGWIKNCAEKSPLCFFLTGSFSGSQSELLNLGVQRVFLKPFAIKEVVAEIELTLKQRKLRAG